MYLLMERELKRKKLGAIFKRLPSLDVLDDINYRCLTIGFPLHHAGDHHGIDLRGRYAWGSLWSLDPKRGMVPHHVLLYAALLQRLTDDVAGAVDKAAILAVWHQTSARCLFTFLAVNHVLLASGLHT